MHTAKLTKEQKNLCSLIQSKKNNPLKNHLSCSVKPKQNYLLYFCERIKFTFFFQKTFQRFVGKYFAIISVSDLHVVAFKVLVIKLLPSQILWDICVCRCEKWTRWKMRKHQWCTDACGRVHMLWKRVRPMPC